MSRSHWQTAALLLAALFAAPPAHSAPADDDQDRAARIQAMTAEQKEKIQRRKERFDALQEDERNRLRKLHDDIASQPNAERLLAVLDRYHRWLKTIPSAQQAELMGLPIDKRVEKIKEIRNQHFNEMAWQLKKEDFEMINAWMEDFATRHESEIQMKLPPESAFRLVTAPNPKARADLLVYYVFGVRRPPGMPEPTDEELAALAAQLPETLQTELTLQDNDEQRRALIMSCVRLAHFTRYAPPFPTEEELGKYYAGLDGADRDRLDKLDPQEMRRELLRLYFRRFPRGGWGRRGDGPPRDAGKGSDAEQRQEKSSDQGLPEKTSTATPATSKD